jgi:hypothetical protein
MGGLSLQNPTYITGLMPPVSAHVVVIPPGNQSLCQHKHPFIITDIPTYAARDQSATVLNFLRCHRRRLCKSVCVLIGVRLGTPPLRTRSGLIYSHFDDVVVDSLGGLNRAMAESIPHIIQRVPVLGVHHPIRDRVSERVRCHVAGVAA